MKSTRRHFLSKSALGLVGLGVSGGLALYSYQRGLRLPTLHWDPLQPTSEFLLTGIKRAFGTDLIQTSNSQTQADASFRAFAPEPTLSLQSLKPQTLRFRINNVIADAELRLDADRKTTFTEQRNGTRRDVVIELNANQKVVLNWKLAKQQSYSFASIGDSGGDKELDWCLKRAHALGARFLLHLGDFNYQSGDYERAIELFNNSPLPVYITIGNHDFHENGAIYGQFLREIGPLNNSFAIGKTRYANIDTAANFLPYAAGQRGNLFEQMQQQAGFTDTVAFTHRPLHDPAPEADSNHDIGSSGERDWLVHSLKQVGAPTLLSGHIHIYDRSDFNGIDNIIVGQGLGHQDLIVGHDYSKLAIGQVDADGKVTYTTADLAMPMDIHCHPRVDPVKDSLRAGPNQELIETIEKACKHAV